MKNKNLSWFAALLVFALLLWCTAATPGKIADPSTCACSPSSATSAVKTDPKRGTANAEAANAQQASTQQENFRITTSPIFNR